MTFFRNIDHSQTYNKCTVTLHVLLKSVMKKVCEQKQQTKDYEQISARPLLFSSNFE